MNLELIQKLVKLANNNPNENEANSAARRVCKLIAEGEFKYIADVAKPIPVQQKPTVNQDDLADLLSRLKRDYGYQSYQQAGYNPYNPRSNYYQPYQPTEEKSDWYYNTIYMCYANLRTGEKISAIEYQNRFR